MDGEIIDPAAPDEVVATEPVARVGGGRFAPGHKRLGGRAKGTPNKISWHARQRAEAAGFDPIAIAIELILHGRLPAIKGRPRDKATREERISMLKEILQYMLPKLSATQVTGSDDGPIKIASLDIMELMKNPEMAAAAQAISLGLVEQERERMGIPLPDPKRLG